MLIQFSVKNYKTFKDKATISMVASNYNKETREEDNVFTNEKYGLRLLKSAVLYGANASGKSKFIDAFDTMRHLVRNSSKESLRGDEIPIDSFKLNTETEAAPSEFEVIFICNNVMYRYGFEADNKKIVSEWLYQKPKTKETELFYRQHQDFSGVNNRKFPKGATIGRAGLVKDNTLLLSAAAQFNDDIAGNLLDWFRRVGFVSGLRDSPYKAYTIHKSEQIKYKRQILDFLKNADLGIEDFIPEDFDLEDLPKDMPQELRDLIRKSSKDGERVFSDILITHKKYDKSSKPVGSITFSLEGDESSGTGKFFGLIGPVLDTLEKGDVLFIDELDSKLHPNLVHKIVSLFNSKKYNPNNAQLVFNTHDTNLLSSGLFRKDQVWFTEKDRYGAAHLYSLADFKSADVRHDEEFEKNYIRGKYGAIPFLGSFDNLPNL